jgi:hypothetical protein
MRLLIAAIALSAPAWLAIADSPTISRAPDSTDPVSGSCEAFVQATVRGVQDNEGVVHTGDCGFTRFRPLFNGLDQADYLDAVRKRLFDPPFTIESFRGDARRDAGRFCARAFDFAIDLRAEVQVSMLDWRHGKKANSECAREWERLKRIIRNHEEQHARDVKPLLDAAAARLRQINPINCAGSNKDAIDGLAPLIITALNTWFRSIKDDWDVRQSRLDNSGKDRCSIDCSKCKERKLSFRGVTLTARMPEGVTSQINITGTTCGEPVSGDWDIVNTTTLIVPQVPLRQTRTGRPFKTDCLLDGSDQAKGREQILLTSPGGYAGWYCIYQPAVGTQPAKINIRMPKLQMSGGVSFDPPHDHSVNVIDEGECKTSAPKPPPPLPRTPPPSPRVPLS